MIRDDVRCSEVVELLGDYLEGVLPVEHRATLEQHLLFCESCATFLDQLRTSIALTALLREEDVPSQVGDRALRMFQEREERSEP
jgi:predicted anti-sigma-YlaC factor YlaD